VVANATRSLAGKAGAALIITCIWDEAIIDDAHLQLRNIPEVRAEILENFGSPGRNSSPPNKLIDYRN
jgi:hypothetical protein